MENNTVINENPNMTSKKRIWNPFKSLKFRKYFTNTIIYIVLIVMCLIWVFPFIWAILQGFTNKGTNAQYYLFPGLLVDNIEGFKWVGFSEIQTDVAWVWSLKPFEVLLGISENTSSVGGVAPHDLDGKFPIWFGNTIILAILSTLISTLFVLMTSYALSRFRFKGRTAMMKVNLILGMFPGFLGMIINYWLMYSLGLAGTFWSLIILYSAGAGMGFYISKGFFDTISKSIDEAAMIDGATKSQIFFKITLPLSKPIVVYTILTSFMGPWGDYISASYIIGNGNKDQWTVPIGLYNMISGAQTYGSAYYNCFYAGALLIAIPITALFLFMQKYYVSGVTGGSVKG